MHEGSAAKVKDFGKVAVLMGGDSAEREISLMGGRAVLDSLLASGVDAMAIDPGSDLLTQLKTEKINRVFIMLHGRKGEDGKLQGALEFMGIPYTGSGVLASALAMDKIRCKRIWQSLGINTPPFVELNAHSDWRAVMEELGVAFVKPVKEGSSIGISKATTADELAQAYALASEFDNAVVAEKFIDGPEYSVTVLGEEILPAVGMKAAATFYDYEAKYFSDQTRYFCPCDLDDEATQRLHAMVRAAYDAIGCQGWGRIDVMADAEGNFWLLEVNTVPGMTGHSLVPMAARAAGLSFDALVLEILTSSRISREKD